MHGLHNRYLEEKNKMFAVSHKLLEELKVIATEVDFHTNQLFLCQRYQSVYTSFRIGSYCCC